MTTREEKLNEIERRLGYSSDEFGIDTIDKLSSEVDNAEYVGEPLTVQEVLDDMSWNYCRKCRGVLDGGWFNFEKDFDSGPETCYEGKTYIEVLEEEQPGITEKLKELYKTHPNAKVWCWDCIDKYFAAKEMSGKQKGGLNFEDITDSGLQNLIDSTQACLDEIKREQAGRVFRRKHKLYSDYTYKPRDVEYDDDDKDVIDE